MFIYKYARDKIILELFLSKMVFKLVRCDTTEPCKIQLPTGTHLIGRGKLLDCDDKRVSRNHGELEVTEDLVTIKALHQNPCFYLKKGISETQILRHNCNVNLCHGDRFGLLPESYWYELLLCNMPDISNQPLETDREENVSEKVKTVEQIVEEANSDKTIFSSDLNPEESEKEFSEDTNADMTNANNLIDAVEKDDIPNSPSLLTPENQSSTQDYDINDQHVSANSTEQPDVSKSPAKRTHSSEEASETDGTKRVKVESNIKQESEDAEAGPSNDKGDNSCNKGSASPQSPAKPANNEPLRERCIYGANCYRKNPQHKVQFSHPGDKDWGVGERGVCPWGAGCRRRDPRHWRDHQHPPGVEPPPPGAHRPGKGRKNTNQVKKRKDPELSPESNVILTGKRPRKTVNRPNWSGSESENEYDLEDPFLTDGSDEWEPPSDISESQDYSQNTED